MPTYTDKWSALPALTTYLSTELNGMVDQAKVIGAAIVAANQKWMVASLSLATQLSARKTGANVALYVVKSFNGGSTYEYGSASLTPPPSSLAGMFALDASVTAREVNILVFIPACTHCEILVLNDTGQTLAATLNTLKYAFVSEIQE